MSAFAVVETTHMSVPPRGAEVVIRERIGRAMRDWGNFEERLEREAVKRDRLLGRGRN